MFFAVEVTLPVELADAVQYERDFVRVTVSRNQMRQRLNQNPNRWIWAEDDWSQLFGLPCRRFHCNNDQRKMML
jgi:hypothetical protein